MDLALYPLDFAAFQKMCDRHPSRSHTDGVSVGLPSCSTFNFHDGLISATSGNSIV
jgi:hypothetical protein